MNSELILSGLFVLLLLFLSAFFSGSETAMTAASRARLLKMAKDGHKRAQLVNRLRGDPEGLIGTILLGNNFVNILASAFATSVLTQVFGLAAIAYATLGMTFLVLVFAEVLPKTIALNKPTKMSLFVSPAILPLVWLLAPITRTVQTLVRGTLSLFGFKLSAAIGQSIADEELRGAIELHAKHLNTLPEESAMLRSILDLDEVTVEDIMIHRQSIIMIDADSPIEKIVKDVLDSPFTRIPVWQDEPDNIIGLIHARVLTRELNRVKYDPTNLKLKKVMAEPWFIQESTSLIDQLAAFRERREHFAHVLDEYGSFLGIVTLEDVLEEIVGEIDDEHDESVPGVKPQKDGSYTVDGTVTIRDLNRQFDWSLPDEQASTVAGLILHESRDIPKAGQLFQFYDFRFKILRRVRQQITLVRIYPPKKISIDS